MSVYEWTRETQALIRSWQVEAAEQENLARRLTGAERSAAVAHGNTKSACASALQRLMWTHGLAVAPKGAKR